MMDYGYDNTIYCFTCTELDNVKHILTEEFIILPDGKCKQEKNNDDSLSLVTANFELLKILGKGRFGTVKEAFFHNQRVAAKFFHGVLMTEAIKLICVDMIKATVDLKHPNLVQMLGASLNKELVILTELMSINLKVLLEHECLNYEQVIAIFLQLTDALNYLHTRSPIPVLHKDICDTNVLLNQTKCNGCENCWMAKLSDYTIACFLQQIDQFSLGNGKYVAPEFHDQCKHTPKMDIFSIGAVLKQMMDGRENTAANIYQLIHWCMDNDMKQRPSAKQLMEQIHKYFCLCKLCTYYNSEQKHLLHMV